jgi:hypothetical protein
LTDRTADPEDRLASFVSAPELFALRACDYRGTSESHIEHLLS